MLTQDRNEIFKELPSLQWSCAKGHFDGTRNEQQSKVQEKVARGLFLPNQRSKRTRAAILVFMASAYLQATPVA
jgi:hypothetical protein